MRTYTSKVAIRFLLLALATPWLVNSYRLQQPTQSAQVQTLLVAQSQQNSEKIPHRGSGRREVVTTSKALTCTA